MNFEQKISEEMKNAMKSGNKLRLETMRSIRAAILEFKTSGINREMNDDDAMKILQSGAKKRKESADIYKQAGRMDLYEKESAELAILEEFLPKQMAADDIEKIVDGIIAETGAQDMKDLGKVMGPAMKAVAGKADGSEVQKIVREKLSNL